MDNWLDDGWIQGSYSKDATSLPLGRSHDVDSLPLASHPCAQPKEPGPSVKGIRESQDSQSSTPQGTNISHLGKRKIIFKTPLKGDMLVLRRVPQQKKLFWFWCDYRSDPSVDIHNTQVPHPHHEIVGPDRMRFGMRSKPTDARAVFPKQGGRTAKNPHQCHLASPPVAVMLQQIPCWVANDVSNFANRLRSATCKSQREKTCLKSSSKHLRC